MANELQQAADACGNLAKQFRSVLTLADAVGKLGDIDAHRLELEKQRDAAKAELDSVMASLADAKSVSELAAAKETARAALASMRADTEREKARLDSIRADAASEAAKVEKLKVEVGVAEKKLTTMRADIDAMKKRFG